MPVGIPKRKFWFKMLRLVYERKPKTMTPRCMYLAGVLALCVASTARADSILYESATNGGGLANGGNGVGPVQFLGSEFTLNSAATITNIIGEVHSFLGPNTFFMTLLELSG